jgi:hypothetical protein
MSLTLNFSLILQWTHKFSSIVTCSHLTLGVYTAHPHAHIYTMWRKHCPSCPFELIQC